MVKPEMHPEFKAAIESNDYGAMIAIALEARFSDERCECEEPLLTGSDLMCGKCLRENESQRPLAQAASRKRYEDWCDEHGMRLPDGSCP